MLDLGRSSSLAPAMDRATIEIGLLNNLGDAAMERGERQVVELLGEAAGDRPVRLRFFALPQIARGPASRTRVETVYAPYEHLRTSRLDGLIVTGCEPRAARLPDEPFWRELTQIIDWAEHNTRSTIWSCLAAHAAVLHLDAIERVPLPAKRTGLYPARRAADHPLLEGIADGLPVAHSRHNDLDEAALAAAGYKVLTRAGGVDAFVKRWRSLFVYLQGHPEYDAGALAREYRRDALRALEGEAPYPALPAAYFAPEMAASLRAFEAAARCGAAARDAFPLDRPLDGQAGAGVLPFDRGFAGTLFRNWLRLLGDGRPC